MIKSDCITDIGDSANQYFMEDCRITMTKRIPDNSIDLILCSPPYDDIRTYKGNIKKDKHNVFSFPFEEIAQLLTKKLTKGGVIVWVVGDSVIDGTETGNSFRQALYFMDECGLKLHDTMIYEKNGTSFPAKRKGKRYSQIFEYMFVFSKGKIKTGNLICDKKNKWQGWTNWGKKSIRSGGDDLKVTTDNKPIPEFSPRNNIWKYITGAGYSAKDKIAHEHPAIFPDLLAHDNILTWTDECDVVYDPFAGSGTVLKMAKYLDRFYIGSEMTVEYEPIIKERLESDKFALKSVNDRTDKDMTKDVTKIV